MTCGPIDQGIDGGIDNASLAVAALDKLLRPLVDYDPDCVVELLITPNVGPPVLMTYPPRIPAVWTEDEISSVDEAQYAEIINRLCDIQVYDSLDGVPQPHIVSLDADAKAAWS